MKAIKYLLVGLVFGIIMYKSQAVSWYRIYEMFRFESFHMYGIIGSALGLGVLGISLIKRFKLKDLSGNPIQFTPKQKSVPRYLIGGTLFGLGWALVGACPGPMFTLLGTGALTIGLVLLGAVLGTFLYGMLRGKLPH